MIDKKEMFSMVYWLALSVLIVSLVVFSILVLFNGKNISFAIISTSPIIIASCIILWIGDVTKNVVISNKVSTAIFTSFILVILSNAGMLIAEHFKPEKLEISHFRIFDEAYIKYDSDVPYLDELNERPNKTFKLNEKNDLVIAFGCKVSNIKIEQNEKIDIFADILLVNDDEEIISFNKPNDRNKISEWEGKSLITKLTVKKVKQYFDVNANEMVYLMIIDEINPCVIKDNPTLNLLFRVYDKKSNQFASHNVPVHLKQRDERG